MARRRNHTDNRCASDGDRRTIHDRDGPFTVGRLPDCSLILSDENVSRHHAVIQRAPGGWTLTDHGSTNGTTVNGTPINEAQLQSGDHIVFGATPATFEAR